MSKELASRTMQGEETLISDGHILKYYYRIGQGAELLNFVIPDFCVIATIRQGATASWLPKLPPGDAYLCQVRYRSANGIQGIAPAPACQEDQNALLQ
jgi:hypothetical protein